MKVGIVLLASWVEFLDVEAFEDILDDLMTLFDLLCVLVLGFCLFCEFAAVGYTVCDFEEFLGDFGDCEIFAFFDLPV